MTDPLDELVDRYLNEVSWAMGGKLAEQQAARDELREHIHAEAEDLALQGVDRESAVIQALHDLGEPSELGRAMRRSLGSRALRRPLRQPEGALVFGPRRERHMPRVGVMFALMGIAATSGVVALIYVWP
jgi:hypothetical protein